ncbi:hypothetical protein ACFSVJ_12940 [Prauserella oleivorans]
MSIFGQVWVFSAIAFVLGALLAWLFLVRPAQRRIRELERRLAASESEPAPVAEPEPRAPSAKPSADEPADEDVAPMTRRFVPAGQQPDDTETTQHITRPTEWMERDSLEEYRARRGEPERPVEEDDLHPAEQPWDAEQDRPDVASVLSPDDSMRSGPRADGPFQPTEPRQLPDPAPEPEQPEPKRSGSLFEPGAYEPQETAPPERPATPPPAETPEPDDAPPAYAFGEAGATPDDDAVNQTQVLPKRQPRKPAGGFDPPKPIQPSMRPVTRREPDTTGVQSGSLFEPTVAPGAGPAPAREPAPPSAAEPVRDEGADSAPPGLSVPAPPCRCRAVRALPRSSP